jgi:hypothetical protein
MINLDPDLVAQMSLQRGINFRSLAEKMGNCSGAEVRGICTEAGKLNSFGIAFFQALTTIVCVSVGMYALRERRQYVGQEDFVSRRLSHSLTRRSDNDADRICYRLHRKWRLPRYSRRTRRVTLRSTSCSTSCTYQVDWNARGVVTTKYDKLRWFDFCSIVCKNQNYSE